VSHLGGSVGHSEGKGGESGVSILRFLCGSPRLCRLRTEGLVHMSKYWTYRSHAGDISLVNLVVCYRQIFGFHYCFNGCVGRETRWRTCGSLSWARGLCREPFFSVAVGFVQCCWWLVKGCHVRGLPTGSVCGAYVDWRGKRKCHVYQVFPCRVYIDSNHRDSQIWVTACSWLPSSSNLLD
jgi:hypothetical protein